MTKEEFLKTLKNPKKKLLAQMIFNGVPDEEIIPLYGKIRLLEMRSIIYHALNGTVKVCITCGIT